MTISSEEVERRSRRHARVKVARTSSAALGLCGLLFGVAMHLGGAPALSVPLWATVALGTVWFAGIDPAAHRRDLLLQAAAVLFALAAFQLVPLPPSLLSFLDARSAQLTAGALDPFHIDRANAWRPLHLDPGNGWINLQYLVGLVAAYLAARQVARRGHGEMLATGAALTTLWIALLALMHKFLGVDQVYGFYAPLQGAASLISPLINPNHLAAYTGAGAILWAGRAGSTQNSAGTIVNWVASAVCGAVCALSLSRAGVAAGLGGMVLFATFMTWSHAPSERAKRVSLQVAAGAAVATMAGAFVAWTALRAEFAGGDVSKLTALRLELALLLQHPLVGVGAGALRSLVVSSGMWSEPAVPDYAESLPVDLALSIGPLGALVVLALAGTWLWRVRLRKRNTPRPIEIAIFCALVSLVVHDLLDFALWLGATGYLAAVLAALLTTQTETAGVAAPKRGSRGRHRAWIAAAVLASAAVGVITARSASYLDDHNAISDPPISDAARRAAMLRHPGDAFLAYAGAIEALRVHDERALRYLNRAMTLAPNWSGPHLLLIRALLARGLRSQALVEIRYAAASANPPWDFLGHTLAALRPTDDEILRATPSGQRGRQLLAALGVATAGTPLAERTDALLEAREPNDPALLAREAERAGARHDTTRERALFERLIRLQPRETAGYTGVARMDVDAGDSTAAERVLRAGVRAGAEQRVLLGVLADVQTQRHDAAAMRATMQRVMDLSGADVAQRITALAQLAGYELRLGNNGAALTALSRADEMSMPEHPYLGQILDAAQRLHDVPRMRGVCFTLSERGELSDGQRQLCSAIDTGPSAGAP